MPGVSLGNVNPIEAAIGSGWAGSCDPVGSMAPLSGSDDRVRAILGC